MEILKELLSLALFQLEDHVAKDEEIEFAYQNIETALQALCCKKIGEENA